MTTKEDIKAILANSLSMSSDELADTILLEGGSIESLRYVEMLLVIESEYGVQTSDDELKNLENIGDLIQLIFNKIGTQRCQSS